MIASGGVTAAEVASGAAFKNRTFLGYPVEVTQVMPKTDANSQVACLFGDLALASDFGDRQQTSIATSEHLYFASNEMAIRGIERVDINNHDVGSATEAGPIVGLLTASG
jgi:HK97 family phage major capsid protein